MKNQFWRTCLLSPLFLGTVLVQSEVSAQEINPYSTEFNQVTNVNQLRDVSPGDWAYEELRSLVDRYSDARSLARHRLRGVASLHCRLSQSNLWRKSLPISL